MSETATATINPTTPATAKDPTNRRVSLDDAAAVKKVLDAQASGAEFIKFDPSVFTRFALVRGVETVWSLTHFSPELGSFRCLQDPQNPICCNALGAARVNMTAPAWTYLNASRVDGTLPRAVFVGIGQGGALGRIGQPQVPQFAFAGGQAFADLAQRLRLPQVAEQHGHELAPATEAAGMTLAPVLGHGPFKLVAGKQLQHLAENAGYSYRGGGGPPIWFTSSQRKP